MQISFKNSWESITNVSPSGGGIANKLRCLFVKGIVKSIGRNCVIQPGVEINEGCVLGDSTGIGPDSTIGAETYFKGHSTTGPNIHIFTSGHYYDKNIHRFNGDTPIDPVHIGENVWIGYGTIITPGVTIGDCVIIGAGSVVTKDIPSGVMAAGNPCKIKKIIDETKATNTLFE